MKTELEQVKKIFPEAYIKNNNEGQEISLKLNIGEYEPIIYRIDRYGGKYVLLVYSGNVKCGNPDKEICKSKDFNKILKVLQAIKDCE